MITILCTSSEDTFNLLVGTSRLSVDGKLYGAIPGITQNCSLGDFISNSNVGYIITDPKKITFGDINLSTDSFNDVMVNTSSGAFVTKLPIDQTGKVNFEILDIYAKITDELKNRGLTKGTQEYLVNEAKLLKKNGLDVLIDSNTGLPNPKYFRNFLVLEGITSGKAYGVESINGKKQSINDIDSKLIINGIIDQKNNGIINDLNLEINVSFKLFLFNEL